MKNLQEELDKALNFIEDECGQCIFFETDDCPKKGKVFKTSKYKGCRKFYT